MIGLVLVTHGRLAEEFIAATEHVVGPQEDLRAVCIGPDDDMDLRKTEIQEAVQEVNRGDGVIILTDMFGGTPSNLALALMEKGKVEVLAGINLPMLIKIASLRKDTPLEQAVSEAAESGRKYINVASKVLQT
ncbi:MAG: PTS sugar transporter subunit IIA [Proteobacteria bacterium]|nr:PTS sugar transporter subunit IIA [Pseudomonadota bacterium]MCH8172391.1 PTS sugar transporter subunit IIA [Pseudomonadota bacterium]